MIKIDENRHEEKLILILLSHFASILHATLFKIIIKSEFTLRKEKETRKSSI